MKAKITIFVIFMFLSTIIFSQDYQWTNYMNASANVSVEAVGTDASDNVYCVVAFINNATIYGRTTSKTITNRLATTTDIALVKYSPAGEILWTRSFGSTGNETYKRFLCDDSGNCYITAQYRGQTYFDVDGGTDSSLAAPTSTLDMLMTKYDSNGNVVFYKAIITGPSNENATTLTFNNDKTKLIVSGMYQGAAIFNNGVGTVYTPASKAGFYSEFDLNGDCQKASAFFDNTDGVIRGIAETTAGAFIFGYYKNSLTFFDGTSTSVVSNGSSTNQDLFVLMLDPAQKILWSNEMDGEGVEEPYRAVTDGSNFYIAGYSTKGTTVPTLTFNSIDNNNIVLTNSGNDDGYLAKIDVNGNVNWAKLIGSTSSDRIQHLSIHNNLIFFSGAFNSTTLKLGKDTLTRNASYDMFFGYSDLNGNIYGGNSVGGSNEEWGYWSTEDDNNEILIGGIYKSLSLTVEEDILTNTVTTKSNGLVVKACPQIRFIGLNNTYCLTDPSSTLTGYPSGGTFSGNGVTGNTFSPSGLAGGAHAITYTYNTVPAGCSNSYTTYTTVPETPVITGLASSYCLNEGVTTLTATPAGGTFTIDGVSRTEFDPAVEGVGIANVQYSFTDIPTGCSMVTSQNVTVIDTTFITFLPLNNVCDNTADFSLIGKATPLGGIYSGVGVSGTEFSASTAGVNASPGHTITYTYDDGTCISVAKGIQKVYGNTSVTFSPVSATCENSAGISLNSYVSLTGGTFSGVGISGTSFYPSIAGASATPYNIQYVYTDGNSCNDTTVQTILVNDLPSATISAVSDPVNYGFTTVLSATGIGGSGAGYTYLWSPADSLTDVATMQNPETKVMRETTVFSVTVTDGNNCSSNGDDIVLNVVGGPLLISTSGVSVCPGQNGQISVLPSGGSGNYSYSWSPSADLDDPNISNPIALGLTVPTIFSVTVTDVNTLETKTATATVSMYTPPTISVSATSSTLCQGASTTLSASALNSTFTWDNGLGLGDSHIISPVISTTYNVTATDNHGCTDSDLISITVNSLPTIVASSNANPLCVGSSATISASGAVSYVWDQTLGVGASHLISPVSTTTYTVTGTDINNCTDTDVITVTVNPIPTVSFSPVSNQCNIATPLNLNSFVSPVGGTFSGNGVSGTDFIASTAGVGSHTITYNYTDVNSCSGSAQRTITVIALPTVTFNAITPNPVCENGNVSSRLDLLVSPTGGTFTGTGVASSATKWFFYPSQAGASATPYTITYAYTSPTTGCTNTATQDISVNAIPTVTFNALSPVCFNDSPVTLSALPVGGTFSGSGVSGTTFTPATAGVGTKNISYSYTDPSTGCTNTVTQSQVVNAVPVVSFISTINPVCLNDPSFSLTGYITPGGGTFSGSGISGNMFDPAVAGVNTAPGHTIIYSYTDLNGCTNTDSEVIYVNGLPTITWDAATPSSSCSEDAAVVLAATPLGGSFSGSAVLNGVFYPNLAPIGINTLTYSYTDIAGNGCSNSQTTNITVNQVPSIVVSGQTTVCEGTPATISVSGNASTYDWDNGLGSGTSFSVSPSTTTVYTVTATNASGCEVIDEVTVSINSLPVLFASSDAGICVGQSTDISVVGNAVSYSWSNGSTAQSQTVSPIVNTTYTVTGTSADLCTSSDAVSITVNSNPTVSASADATICQGEQTTISVSGSANSYTWDNGLGSGTSFDVTPLISTTYTVTGVNGQGCSGTDLVTITVNPIPSVYASQDVSICAGDATTITVGGNASSYSWSNGSSSMSQSVSPATTTTYTVTGTLNSCTATDQVIVTTNTKPTVTASADVNICIGESTTISVTGTATSYTWDNGLGSGTSFTVSPVVTTTYTVTGTNASGCDVTDQVTVTVNSIPSVSFTSAIDPLCVNDDPIALFGYVSPGGGAFTGAGLGGNSFYPNAAGVNVAPGHLLTYTYTDGNNCSNSATTYIIVNDVPTVNWDASVPSTVCSNAAAISLVATPAGGSFSGNGVAGSNFYPNIATIGNNILTYSYTSVDGCSGSAQKSIAVNAIPTISTFGSAAICDVSPTNIGVTGDATSYMWDNGLGAGTSFSVTPAYTTVYTVTATSAQACSTTGQVTVSVTTTPTVIASADKTICLGDSTQLTVVGNATTYTWSNGESGSSIYVKPTTTTQYIVTGTAQGGCFSTDTVVVTVNTVPVAVTASANKSSMCIGETPLPVLSAVGALSYSWDNGLGDGQIKTANPTTTTTYTVTGTNAQGCSATAQVTITVKPLPVVTASADANICATGSTTISVSGDATSYNWSDGLGTATSVVVSPTADKTYTVTGTLNGCTSTDQVKVSLRSLPVVNATTDDATLCEGSSTMIHATGGVTYTWDNGLGVGSDKTVTPTTTTTYDVTVTDQYGCTASDNVTVTTLTLPTVSVTPDLTEICKGSSALLTASGANLYVWNQGLGSSSQHTVSPVTTTTYTVTGTDNNSCQNSASVTITVNENPVAIIDVPQSVIGYGTSVQLNGFANSGSGTGYSYKWSPATSLADPDDTQNPNTTTLSTSTVFELVVTDDKLCSSEIASQTITVTGGALSINASDEVICNGENVKISAIVSGGSGNYSYLWSPTTGLSSSTIATPIVSGLTATTTYTVTVTDNVSAEQKTKAVIVTVNDVPTVTASADVSICSGNTTTISVSGSALTYSWNNGLGSGVTFDVNPASTTNYTVTGTDANGCVNTDDVIISILQSPDKPSITAIGNTTICEGDSVYLLAPNVNGYTYDWSNGSTTQTIYAKSSGKVSVKITNSAGCESVASDSVAITVNVAPQKPIVLVSGETTFCEGMGAATLEGPAGFNYVWSNGETTQSITITQAGNYSLKVVDANSCSSVNSDVTTVIVNPKPATPIAIVIGKTDICFGDSTLVYSPLYSGINYNWSNGETSNQFYAKIDGDYTLTTSNSSGCVSDQSPIASVMMSAGPAKPILSQSGNIHLCNNDVVSISAPAGYTYLWSNGAQTQSISINSEGNYYVVVFDGSECSSIPSDTAFVTKTDLTSASLTEDMIVCSASNIELVAKGGVIYEWNTGDTNDTIYVSPTASTTYTVTISDAITCSVEKSVSITLSSGYAVDLGNDIEICEGDYVYIDAGDGVDYLWSNSATTQTIFVSPSIPTEYSVIVSGNGCVGYDTIVVTPKSKPVVELGANIEICEGLSTIIDAGVFDSYKWSTNETSASISVNSSGTYFVTVTTNGCSSTDNISVSVLETPVIELIPTEATCGQSDGAISSNVSGGTGTYTYSWTSIKQTNPLPQTASLLNIPSDIYSLVVSDGKCSSVAQGIVNDYINYDAITGIGANKTVICDGDSVMLWATANAVSYRWSPSESLLTVDYKDTVWAKPTQTTTYAFTAFAATCMSAETVTITVIPYPSVNLGEDIVACEGTNVVLDAGSFVGYKWSDGSNIQTLTVDYNGTYSVTVSNGACSDSDTINVSFMEKPLISFSSTPTDCGINTGSLDVIASGGSGNYTYTWFDNSTNSTISNLSSGLYSVTVSDDNCSSVATGIVNETGGPAFTLTANDNIILFGQTTTLTASGAGNYVWTMTPDMKVISESEVTVSPSSTKTYYVEGSVLGCSTVNEITITVETEVPVDLGADKQICEGETVVLDAGIADSYIWNTGSSNRTITVSVSGTYSVTITQAGAHGVDYVDVTVNEIPQASITTTDATCGSNNGAAQLTIVGSSDGLSYNWSNGATTSSITGVVSGVYTVTVSNAVCSNEFIASISETGGPVLTVTTDKTEVCPGETTRITVQGADTYEWQNDATLTVVSGSEADVTPLNNTIYVVSGTTGSCTTIEEIEISVKPLPVNNLGATTKVCIGESVDLNAGIADSYIWSTGETDQTISVDEPGSYEVTVTLNGCSDVFATNLVNSASANIIATIVKPDCSMSNGSIDVVINGGSGAYTYNWEDMSTDLNRTNLPLGIYTLMVNDGNCLVSKEIALEETGAPILDIISSDYEICSGESATVYASGADSYEWSTKNGNILSTNDMLQFTPSTSIEVIVSGTQSGCTGLETFTISVNPTPEVTVTNLLDSYCSDYGLIDIEGAPVGSIYVDGKMKESVVTSALTVGSHLISYKYTDTKTGCSASENQTISIVASPVVAFTNLDTEICSSEIFTPVATPAGGTFFANGVSLSGFSLSSLANGEEFELEYVYLDLTSGCSNSVKSNVTSFKNPIANFSSFREGFTVAFINNSQNSDTYSWNFANKGTSTAESPTFNFVDRGLYNVILTASNAGCKSASKTVSVDLLKTDISEIDADVNFKVSPNPTSGVFVAEYNSPENEEVVVYVLNENGQKIISETVSKESETIAIKFDLSNEARGIYTVVLTSDSNTLIRKVVIK